MMTKDYIQAEELLQKNQNNNDSSSNYKNFHHITFYVGNAKQAAQFYSLRFGFNISMYQGLETGNREHSLYLVEKNDIKFVFKSALYPNNAKFYNLYQKHGDFVRDIAFEVDNCELVYRKAIERGAKGILKPKAYKDKFNKDGYVIMASIQTYGDTIHTFIEKTHYKGNFLPNYQEYKYKNDPLNNVLKSFDTYLNYVDHCVGNQSENEMETICDFYEKVLGFHRFWSVDDSQIHTQYSSLKSIVMASPDEKIKMPINEPAKGLRKSQIQEYVDHHGGSGVQHLALNTSDIIKAVQSLRSRGMVFLDVPESYYESLRHRLKNSKVSVTECLNKIQELNILVDFDDNGYLLQLFTKPLQDRPTFFIEIIQRCNHEGFGAGNFKALFESIERDQEERGNL